MTTGKIEYAPDYKSKSQVRRLAVQQGNTLTRTNELIKQLNERSRLEREVVNAAKFWNRAQGEAAHVTEVDGMVPTVVRAWNKLRKATSDLESFEAEQR